MSQTYALNTYMTRSANDTYLKLRDTEDPEEASAEVGRMYTRKMTQGHKYGRTTHPSLEEKETNGKHTVTSGEWSDTGGARPEREAIQLDNSAAARNTVSTDGVTGAPVRASKRGTK